MATQAINPSEGSQTKSGSASDCLRDWCLRQYNAMSRGRWVEEREWFESALFDQMRQWLEEDPGGGGKLRPMKYNANNPMPMPVSNHFSKTIAGAANSLGADLPRMVGLSDNYDQQNRAAAEAAERAIDAANRESGMEFLNPKLQKQVPLFGMGVTWDTIDVTQTAELIPTVSVNPAGQEVQGDVQQVPTPRIKSEIPTIFEIYLPRDCRDPNLSTLVLRVHRKPTEELKLTYTDVAEDIAPDDKTATVGSSLAFYYIDALRRLTFGSTQNLDDIEPKTVVYEMWCSWTSLPEDVREEIEAEWANAPSEAYQQDGMTRLQAAVAYGVFIVASRGLTLEYGENPYEGNMPATFFCWQKDSVSAYPKGLAVELKPLQKQINRLDSLMELGAMSNGAGTWLIPLTQQNIVKPSGSPSKNLYWDSQGEGKDKPEFVAPSPYNAAIMQRRQMLVAEFQQLGYTSGLENGQMPSGAAAFRSVAYLGAKAEESRKTQRFLWEQAHELRARKLLVLAKKTWDAPRKVRVAGFNNQFGALEIQKADLSGEYEIQVIQDSSKPKTLDEKINALTMLMQGGLVNTQDSQNRDWIFDTLGMNDLNEADHLQYNKSQRDLEVLKQGGTPQESPFEKWDIPLRIFAQYTLTEEFEQMPKPLQAHFLAYTQYVSEKLAIAQGGMQPGATPPGIVPPGMPSLGNPLSKVPGGTAVPGHQGQNVSTPSVEGAATQEGNQFASAVDNRFQ